MQNNDMLEIADKYSSLREQKSELEFQLKELNAEIEDLEKDLIQSMTDSEIESFKRNGKNFILVTKEYPSAVVERKAELYDKMKEQGFEHLFTINTNTLQSTLKELKANNDDVFPEWLDGLVKECEKVSIQLRKGA